MSSSIYKAFRYRLYPNAATQVVFNQWFGCCRKVYNEALDQAQKQYQLGNTKFVNRSNLFSMITKLKADKQYDYLKQVPIHTLQNSLANLLEAYQRFFKKKTGYPKLKSKHNTKQSFTVPCDLSILRNCKFENGYVWVPKIKNLVKFKQHRKLYGEVKSYTITRESTGKWFISFLCKVEQPIEQQKTNVIGLDFGVIDFITASNGFKVPARKFYRRCERKLNKIQKALSKKVKRSNNYKKLKIKLAKIHEHIRNKRTDANHKLSTQLVNENQVICIENLQLSSMSKNHKLAKSLLDQGWYQFTSMLQYKLNWYGGRLSKIDRFYPSSKTCSTCGYKMNSMSLNVREWICPNCGASHDRDINAAQNILIQGLL